MKIKLLSPDAIMPKRADGGSAGFDLYVPKDTIIKPGRNIVPLDFAMQIDDDVEAGVGFDAHIRPRSGFSAKGMEGYGFSDLHISKTPQRFDADVLHGTIDHSYRGNVGVIVKSYEELPFLVAAGTRIAQMVIEHIYTGDLELADELTETVRGEGGFGSTGTH